MCFQFLIAYLITFGTTVGAHRYFTHRGFKAKKALKYFLLVLQTTTAQDPIINWVRDHRVHHKYTDTNSDPYNATRGFFFSHIGWLFLKKHPDVIEAGKKIDLSDVKNDKALQFQKKFVPKNFNYFLLHCNFFLADITPKWRCSLIY
jgi:stearoyl-CoA desaturase (Delta-9 desaturase)